MDLFKASNRITIFRTPTRTYYFYKNVLTAITNYETKKVYIEGKDMRKTTLMKYLTESYPVKYDNFAITECYEIRNLY